MCSWTPGQSPGLNAGLKQPGYNKTLPEWEFVRETFYALAGGLPERRLLFRAQGFD